MYRKAAFKVRKADSASEAVVIVLGIKNTSMDAAINKDAGLNL